MEKCRSQPYKPNPVPAIARSARRRVTTIPLALRLLAGSSDLPGGFGRAVRSAGSPARTRARWGACATLFGLAPRGVLPAIRVTTDAVRSYRTFSPLPFDLPRRGESKGGIFSVPLFRQVTLPGRYPAHCPPEFGLSSHLRPFRATVGKPPCGGLPADTPRCEGRRSSG